MRISILVFSVGAILLASCIEDYPPPITDDDLDILVVDGSLNTSGSAEVKLSRAIALAASETPPVESNAQVHIEDSDGNIFPLSSKGGGIYGIDNIPINSNQAYRLYIKRGDNREYLSAFVSVKSTPPIDSLSWRPNQFRDAIEILVNTHDDMINTRYYQWIFEETYEYTSPFLSLFKYENDMVIGLARSEYVNRCWQSSPSQKIIIGTSEQLSQDIIQNFEIAELPRGSQKLSVKYSMLVKQRALSKEAYTYWLNLQKTTEQLGGLFDPQPGRVNGNIVNTKHASESVIGYFDVSDIKEERIFISNSDLPVDLRTGRDLLGCAVDSVSLQDVGNVGKVAGLSLVSPIVEGIAVVGYTYSREFCTDCRLQGGTTEKPLFWE